MGQTIVRLGVRLGGVVRGMQLGIEHEERCALVVRLQSPALSTDYSEGLIVDVTDDLPDGDYMVTFDGHSMQARKALGIWLPSTAIARTVLPWPWNFRSKKTIGTTHLDKEL